MVSIAVLASIPGAAQRAMGLDALPAYNVDLRETSVSGLSSGAYMADQFYVANSSVLRGVGIVAGGPYFCAQGSITTALNVCMDTFLGEPDPARLFEVASSPFWSLPLCWFRPATPGRRVRLQGLSWNKKAGSPWHTPMYGWWANRWEPQPEWTGGLRFPESLRACIA